MLSVVLYFKNKYLYVILSCIFGILGVFAFSPYDFWPASIISLTGLFIIILDITWKQAAWNTFFWGIGFFGFGLHWIYTGIIQFININSITGVFLIILLILYITCFPVLFSILFIILQSYLIKNYILKIFIAAVLWLITERLRGNTFIGFPWLQFGYTQINGPIKGIAPIFGVEGITLFLIFISGLIAVSIKKQQLYPCLISIIILICITPLSRIKWYTLDPQRTTTIALIQGNINQSFVWNTNNITSIIKTYLQHTLPLLGKTKIIVWPETAIPGYESNHNKFLTLLDFELKKNHTCLITGVIDARYINNKYYYYNSIIVLGNNTPYKYSNNNRYNKHHLVLFAERLPCKFFFESLLIFFRIPISFMQPGLYLQPQLNTEYMKITASICYEIILGNQIRNNFKFDSDFLLTIANDVWFGCSIGPWQHFQMARMRALELGRPLLFCTNNGITAVVQADGSIQSQVPQFISIVLSDNIVPTLGITPYARFGSWWLFYIIIILFTYLFYNNTNQYIKKYK